MDDKDNQRGIGITETAANGEMELEKATAAVSLPSTARSSPPTNTLSNHSSRVYSNSHHTQVRRSTDDREEDLLLESENRRRQYGSSGSSDSLTYFERRDVSEEFSSQTSSNGQLDSELVQSIAQHLETISLQSTTTPQQESCGRYIDSTPLENATFPRRTDFMDVERFHSK